MTFPIIAFIDACCYKLPHENDSDAERAMCGKALFFGSVIFDTLASITCLIIGILGALNLIAMSFAAAYALIGISCGITLLWLAAAVACCKDACQEDNPANDLRRR